MKMIRSTERKWSAKEAFEKGLLTTIVQKVAPPGGTDDEKSALIGAMAFLGRWLEAEALANTLFAKLTPSHQARVGFCLAVAFTRASNFKSGKKWLKAIVKNPKTSVYADSSQAMAFYYFFKGDFQHAFLWGRKALQIALASNDEFIHLAAMDILAHSQVQMGKRSIGMRLFEEAIAKAEQNSFSTIALSARLAKLRYQSEAGLNPHTILEELTQALSRLAAVDTYSRAGLVMEISRQLTLRGRWNQARELLNQEATTIYSFQDRRQEMTLLLRMSEISFRQGDFVGSLHFVRSAHRCLNRVADKLYEARVLGMESKIFLHLPDQEFPIENRLRLSELSQILPSKMNSQILSRATNDKSIVTTPGEDPMHDLFLLLQSDPERGLHELIERGYLGLWPMAYGLLPGKEYLVIDQKGHLISVSSQGVYRSAESVPSRPLKILHQLSQGSCSKQDLISRVWGYEYDSLRHDTLVYAGLTNLRLFLGTASSWIENLDSSWVLKPGVKLIHDKSYKETKLKKSTETVSENEAFYLHPEFSFRQIEALKVLTNRVYWDMKTYKKIFKVSTMTAWRDLNAFTKLGYLVKCGRGPATRYVPQKKAEK